MPILLGEFDLSPGYVGTPREPRWQSFDRSRRSMVFCYYSCLLLGIAFGILNAVLINKFRIQSFIATLAVGSFLAKGVALIVSGGRPINIDEPVVVWIGTYKDRGNRSGCGRHISGGDFDLRHYPGQNSSAQHLPCGGGGRQRGWRV